MATQPTDQQLREIVDKIFEKYDKDKSFTLEPKELQAVLTDTIGKPASEEQAKKFAAAIDTNKDGKVTKMELFELIKKFLASK